MKHGRHVPGLLACVVWANSCAGPWTLDRSADRTVAERRLGVLIAAPHGHEPAFAADVDAADAALRARGFDERELVRLDGCADRQTLSDVLATVGRRVSEWPDGSVFLLFSGHGTVRGDTLATAAPLVAFEHDELAWDEILRTLAGWERVHVTLLADC